MRWVGMPQPGEQRRSLETDSLLVCDSTFLDDATDVAYVCFHYTGGRYGDAAPNGWPERMPLSQWLQHPLASESSLEDVFPKVGERRKSLAKGVCVCRKVIPGSPYRVEYYEEGHPKTRDSEPVSFWRSRPLAPPVEDPKLTEITAERDRLKKRLSRVAGILTLLRKSHDRQLRTEEIFNEKKDYVGAHAASVRSSTLCRIIVWLDDALKEDA